MYSFFPIRLPLNVEMKLFKNCHQIFPTPTQLVREKIFSIFVQPRRVNKSNCFITSIKVKHQLMNFRRKKKIVILKINEEYFATDAG